MEVLTNYERATWAHCGVVQFAQLTGRIVDVPHGPERWTDDALGEIVGDLFADLFHLARLNGVDPVDLIVRGAKHYLVETAEDSDYGDLDVPNAVVPDSLTGVLHALEEKP